MKMKKILAVLSAVAAGSTMIFGQALNAQAEEIISAEETAPVEDVAAPVENVAAPVEDVAESVQESAPVENIAPVGEIAVPAEETDIVTTAVYEDAAPETTVAVDAMFDEYGTETATTATAVKATAVAVSIGTTTTADAETTTTTTTTVVIDTNIYSPIDVNSDKGKAQLADKDIDYNKIYNDFVNNEMANAVNIEGGISETAELGRPQELIHPDDKTEVRVYSEMLGIFAATVHDFCNDGIPELITATNEREVPSGGGVEDVMNNYRSKISYDIWQYDKADNWIKKIATIPSFVPLHLTNNGIFEVGKEEMSVSLVGDTILEEVSADSRGDASSIHLYTMYEVGEGYRLKGSYTIGAEYSMPDKDHKIGYLIGPDSIDELKDAFKAHGVDADVTASLEGKDADIKISNVKNKTPLFDYTADPNENVVNFELKDYTGLHGKASSAAPKSEAKKDVKKEVKKTDSPKTGVSFPIAAAGTGAAAVALTVFTVLSKKKKD